MVVVCVWEEGEKESGEGEDGGDAVVATTLQHTHTHTKEHQPRMSMCRDAAQWRSRST